MNERLLGDFEPTGSACRPGRTMYLPSGSSVMMGEGGVIWFSQDGHLS